VSDWNLNWIYTGISWILLRWHDLWGGLLGEASGWAWVLSIVFLVITVRAVLFPVFVKQIKSQRAMQKVAPQVKELRDKYKHDQQALQKEMMELYRREKANPMMGCLPIFLQIPVFLGLFHVLRLINPQRGDYREAMTTEYGWKLSEFKGAAAADLFGAPLPAAFNSPQKFLAALEADALTVRLVAGLLVLIMVVTTYITQRQMISRSGPPPDPTQAMIQKFMLYGVPASLLISGALFPIGVVIYWVTTNLFSMGQQFWVLSRMPPINAEAVKPAADPAVAKALAPRPGVKPVNPKKGGKRPVATSKAGGGARPAPGGRSDGSGETTTNGRATHGSVPASSADPAPDVGAVSPNGKAGHGAAAAGDDAEKTAKAGAGGAGARRSGGGSARRQQDNRNRKRNSGKR